MTVTSDILTFCFLVHVCKSRRGSTISWKFHEGSQKLRCHLQITSILISYNRMLINTNTGMLDSFPFQVLKSHPCCPVSSNRSAFADGKLTPGRTRAPSTNQPVSISHKSSMKKTTCYINVQRSNGTIIKKKKHYYVYRWIQHSQLSTNDHVATKSILVVTTFLQLRPPARAAFRIHPTTFVHSSA